MCSSIFFRIDTTKRLAKAIEKSEIPPKVFISASAVGQYILQISFKFASALEFFVDEKAHFYFYYMIYTYICLQYHIDISHVHTKTQVPMPVIQTRFTLSQTSP